jgi:hypothetical protein
MYRKFFQIASLIFLAGLSLLYPLIEWLDRWDGPGPSFDSEIQIVALLTLVALIFVLRYLLAGSVVFVLANVFRSLCFRTKPLCAQSISSFHSQLSASPPLLLRI